MYHLIQKKLSSAALVLTLATVMPSAVVLANPIPGSEANLNYAHTDATDNSLDLVSLFAFVPDLPPYSFSIGAVTGPSVANVSIDASDRLVVDPGNNTTTGTLRVEIIGSDLGGTASNFVNITVTNQAPSLGGIGPQSGDEGDTVTFTAVASDPDDASNTLVFSLGGGAPGGASITSDGDFTWVPSEAQGPNAYTIRVIVSDGAGQTDFEDIMVTVAEVNEPPVLAAIGDRNVNEGDPLTFTVSASDPADTPQNTPFTYTLNGAPSGATIDSATGAFSWTPDETQGGASYTFDVEATDSGVPALTASETITVTVAEVNEPPVLAAIGDRNVNEGDPLTFTASASDPADSPQNTPFTYALNGAPSGATIDSATGAFAWTPDETQGGASYTFDVEATDSGVPALATSETITVTVAEVNEPPVLAAIGDRNVDEGDPLTFTASASDPADTPQNTPFSYTLNGAPSGATIDSATGAFAWTPDETQGGASYTFDVEATDSGVPALTTSETITVTVAEVNEPPVLNTVGDRSIDEGNLLSFTVSASDVDIPSTGLNYSLAAGAPAGALIDAGTGVFTWTPTEAQGPNTYPVRVQVTDGGGLLDFEDIVITVDELNEPPVLATIGDRTVNEGSPLTFTASASDPADTPQNTPFSYSLNGAPSGATIDSATGAFAWTPDETQGGASYTFAVEATDSGVPTLTASETITVTVAEVNEPPVLAAIGDQNVDEGDPLTFTASASDPADTPQNTPFTYALSGAPSGATIDSVTGAFAWTPDETQGGASYTFAVEVTDSGLPALTASETITVTVAEINDAPILNVIGDRSIDEETTLSFTATANDSDIPVNGLTFSLSGAPPGATITPGGLFSWTPAEADGPGDFPVTIIVTDDGVPALDDSETFTITVIEINDPPVLIPGGDVPDQTMNEDDGALFVEVRNQFDDPDLGDTPPDTLNVVVLPGYDASLIDVVQSGTGVNVTPLAHRYGSTTVTVGVVDSLGVQATDTFLVDVLSVNDPVQVAAGVGDQGVAEDTPGISVSLAGAFSDADLANGGDTHTVTFSSSDTSLIRATNSPLADLNGTMNFVIEPDENGVATITVTAQDALGSSATLSFTVNVSEVTDPPFVANPLPDVVYAEDPGAQSISLVGVFDDPDLSDGDVQNYSVLTDNPTLIPSATVAGNNLNLDFGADQNGTATVTVTVTDISGQTASDVFLVTVTPVNDDPTQVGPLPDINTFEDDPTTFTIDLAGVFDDVDILTNGDVLTFAMNNSNPTLFDVATLTGSLITLHLGPDQNGNATITVQATDSFGATVSDSFDVNVTGVNDLPVAADDFVGPVDEDPGLIVIPVLDNDYLAEQPTVIASAGLGGVSEGTPTIVLDPGDDPVSQPNGTVTINGNQIEYLPKDDFFGTDYFTYTIVDADGDVSPPATVTIQINQVNDPPEGVQQRTFTIFENQSLMVDPVEGVFAGSYDVDGALLDGSGAPVGSALAAVLTVPPPLGSLSFDGSTGGFNFAPPINFTGEISFFYRLFDGIDVSAGSEFEVRVVINPTPPAPLPPAPGTVAVNYNISNVPLEQTNSVAPNVLVVMDDSGSMDWNMIVDSTDENGGFVLDNDAVASSGQYATSYVYLWDLKNNAYPPSSSFGRLLPTEEALNADSDMTGNRYGVWRARTHLHNQIYYNPSIMYVPWIGQDVNNNDFADADPAAVRLDPVDPSATIDILSSHTYRSTNVPEWDANGGRNNVDVDGTESLYIPRYYTTTATPPLAWDDPHTLVEITPANAPWPATNGREDCAADGDASTCSYVEEIQNFANWFQYYRTREYVTKASIGRVVSEVTDVRVGYETISATGSEEVRLMNELYTEGNKKLLLDNIYSIDSYGGTPLRQALGRAGKIFSCSTGNYCPALPAPDGQCQQNFALLFSDGYWNGGAGVSGNDDSDNSSSFDGGRYADSVNATLADVAMFYYENDIQPTLDDQVPLGSADLDGAPSGTFDANNNTMHQHMKTYAIAFGVSGTLDPSEVPLDPTSTTSPLTGLPFSWPDPFSGPREKIDDMLHAATNGRGRFLSAGDPVELQAAFEQAFLEFTQAASSTSAAAFNSTSLRDGTLLYRGFFDLRDNTGELTATQVNTDGTLAPAPVWRATDMLDGLLPNNRVLVTSDSLTGDGLEFRHGDLAPEQQLMMSESEVDYIRGERTDENQYGGLLRDRPVSNGLLGDIVNSSPVFVGTPRAINRDQAPFPTDDLYSDFAAARFSRSPTVYVGANDGILHGFDAQTGQEVYGYVPNKNMDTSEIYHNDLEDFTSPFYQHKYYVDLTPSLNDAYMRPNRSVTGKEWVTLLIGGTGAGGKGYFALNVTDPAVSFASETTATSTVLWEFTDEDDTYPIDCPGRSESACPATLLGGGALLDPAGRPVKDLGVATNQPTITMSNVKDGGSPARNEWVAVLGNGLNSTAGVAKLFVLFVDRGVDGWGPGDFIKIDTGVGVPVAPAERAGYPNGLGTPTAVDVDLNGTVDWVYAGDRLGNLYRFDLSDANSDNWTATRIFTASYTDGGGTTTMQPILSKPVVSKHPTEEGFLVTFGTGSYVAREDANSQDIQSIYTIWDRGETNPATAQPDTKALRLVEQVMTNVVDDSQSPPQTRRILTSNQVDYVSESGVPGTYGWYIDFDIPRATTTVSGAPNLDGSGLAPPNPQFPGEKAIRRMIFRDGTIIAATVLPSVGSTSCFGARPGSIILFDVLTGGNPVRALVDFNNDGYVDDGDLVDVAGESYSAGILFDQDSLDGSLVDPSVLGGEGDTDFLFISGGNETTSFRILDVNDNRTGRLSWQELD